MEPLTNHDDEPEFTEAHQSHLATTVVPRVKIPKNNRYKTKLLAQYYEVKKEGIPITSPRIKATPTSNGESRPANEYSDLENNTASKSASPMCPGCDSFQEELDKWTGISTDVSKKWGNLSSDILTHCLEEDGEAIPHRLIDTITELDDVPLQLRRFLETPETMLQRWLIERREEQEASQQRISWLEISLQAADERMKEMFEDRRMDYLEISRARREIDQNTMAERKRAKQLEAGRSVEIGDMILVPGFRQEPDDMCTNQPKALFFHAVKKPDVSRDWKSVRFGRPHPLETYLLLNKKLSLQLVVNESPYLKKQTFIRESLEAKAAKIPYKIPVELAQNIRRELLNLSESQFSGGERR